MIWAGLLGLTEVVNKEFKKLYPQYEEIGTAQLSLQHVWGILLKQLPVIGKQIPVKIGRAHV